MKTTTARKIVVPTLGLIVLGYVAGLIMYFNLPESYQAEANIDVTRRVSDLLFNTATFLFGVMGALIALRRPSHRIGWIFLFIGGAAQLALGMYSYAILALFGGQSLPYGPEAAWFTVWLWMPMVTGIIVALLLFPDGKLPSRRWLFVPILAGTAILITLVVAAIIWPLRGPALLTIDDALDGAPAIVDTLVNLANPFMGIALVSAGLSLIFRYRRARREERQQLRLFAFAVGLAISTIFVDLIVDLVTGNPAPSWIVNVMAPLGLLMVPVSAGVAVLRYRLYEIDVVIKKAVAYGVLILFITGVYLVVVLGVGGALVGVGQGNPVLLVSVTALIALIFQPLRVRAHQLANRLVYGQRVSPYEAMAEFSHRMAGVPSLEEVLPRMAESAAKGIGATNARVRVFLPDGTSRASFWPTESEVDSFDRTVGVRYGDEEVGEISVTKASDDPIIEAEERLLADLASQAGLALRNVRLAEELRASRQRLVTAQDEERQRMERDIHDGAQQQLVSMSVKLGLARSLLRKDVDKSEDLLEQIRGEASEAVETLRDLARGLFPQVLVEEGLAAAVRSHVQKAAIPADVESDLDGMRFDLKNEAAIYFVIREALQNASKHAGESQISVTIEGKDSELAFAVKDQGPGFDPNSAKLGSGLQNMKDRIEALGGRLTIESSPGAGTSIKGSIPAQAGRV